MGALPALLSALGAADAASETLGVAGCADGGAAPAAEASARIGAPGWGASVGLLEAVLLVVAPG